MKKQLSILQTFLVTCLLLVIGGGSSWAQETTFFSEDFGSINSTPTYSSYSGYSATDAMFTTGTAKDNYTGDGNIGKNSYKPQNLSNGYEGASGKSGIYQSGTAGTNKIIIKMTNINIKGYSNITLGFGALFGNKDHIIIAKYSIDGGAEKELTLSEYTASNQEWSYITASIQETGKSLTLTFSHTPEKNWTIRMDDISLKGTNPNVKTFKFSATTCTAILGATNNEFPTLSNDYGTSVSYSSSNTDVASVSDKDGTIILNATGTTTITATLDADNKVTASYELTVNQKTTDVVFDFTEKPNKWGITPTSDNSKSNTDGKDLYVEGVKLNTTSGKGSKTCIFSSSSSPTPNLRVYSGGSLTFTAPLGYNISKIVFTGKAVFTTSVGSFSNKTWTGTAEEVTLDRSNSTEIKTASVTLVKVTESISLPATDNGKTYYATFSCSRDVIFTKDVNVNAVKVEDGSLVITKLTIGNYQTNAAKNLEGYYVPANTGVLISGTEDNTQVYYPAANQSVTIDNNQLKPAPINGGMIEFVNGNKYYKLAYSDFNNKTGLGFYWGADNGGAFKVKSGTAYLEVPVTSSPAKGFAFGGDETGITNIDANSSNSRVIYNLAGQRMNDTVKPGLYIINGKKTVVR